MTSRSPLPGEMRIHLLERLLDLLAGVAGKFAATVCAEIGDLEAVILGNLYELVHVVFRLINGKVRHPAPEVNFFESRSSDNVQGILHIILSQSISTCGSP